MANRVRLGYDGSDYSLQISKSGDDIVTDTINTRDLLFNSKDNYRSGVIVSDTDVTTMTTSGVSLPTTADANSNNYIPAYQVIEKGVKTPVLYFLDDRTTGGVGFDFEATMQSGVPTTGGGGLFEFSLGGSGSTVNLVKAAFIDIVESESIVNHGLSGYDYFSTNNYPFLENTRTRGSSDGTVNILMLRIPCQYGKMTNDATLFGNSVLTPSSSGGGGSGGGGSVSAPADPTVSLSSRTSTTDTVSVSSSSGSGNSGTITFAQTTTNVSPTTGFTTTTSYTQPRGSTRYYWASQGGYVSGSTSFVSPAYDNTPTQFTFNDVTGATLSTVYTSNQETIAGLDNNDSAAVSITGGTYSKNGGTYTSSAGTAVNGDTFTVRQTSSSSYGTAVNCTLTIGTISDTYTVTTGAAAPSNPTVSFSSRNNTNETVTVSSTSGSGNSGTITYAQTTTNSSSGASFTTTTTYTQPRGSTRYYWAQQGGLTSGSTSYTSPALDQSPTAFSFNDVTGASLSTTYTSNTITVAGLDYGDSATVSVSGGTYSKNSGGYTSSNGTAVNGDTFSVQQTSSGSFSTTTNCTLTIGTESDTYSVTTLAADTTPDAFDFTNQTGKELSTLYTSNVETITGLNTGASVSISGNSAQFSIAGGAWSTTGTITNNQSLQLRMYSSSSYSTSVSTTVNVGGVTDSWALTTRAQVLASTPNAPTVTQTNNPSGSVNVDVTSSGGSGTIQVSPDNSNWYSNGQDFTQARGSTVTYYARCVSTDNHVSSSASTAKFVPPTVTLGAFSTVNYNSSGGTNNYTITTQKSSGNFDTYSSYWGTVSYSVSNNSGGWLTSSITNTSSGAYSLTASSFSTVGGSRSATVSYTVSTQFGYQYTGTFTVSQDGPAADTTPDAFSFTSNFAATQGQTYTSTVTITGINIGTTLTFSGTTGADYRINSGSYTTSSQTVNNNDTVTVRITAASSAGVTRSGAVTIGGVSSTMYVATPADLVPDQFTFTDVTNAEIQVTYTSTITLSGMTPGFSTNATFSGSSLADFRVNSGSYSQSTKSVQNGDTITARVSGLTTYDTTYTAQITVGGVSDTFSVATESQNTTT